MKNPLAALSAKSQAAAAAFLVAVLVIVNRWLELGMSDTEIATLGAAIAGLVLSVAIVDHGEPAETSVVSTEPLTESERQTARSLLPPALATKLGLCLLLGVGLAACTTATPTVTQPATVSPVATTGQGGTDSAAGQLFGFAVTRPNDGKGSPTPLSQWTFPDGSSTSTRPVLTLRRKYGADGKVTEEFYEPQLGPDGKPLTETVAAGLFIDARNSTFTNSITPQGTVSGSGTTQTGGAAPAATQSTTQTTSVPVTANVPVTLPNGTTIPAGGVIPAGVPVSVFPAGATVTPVP